MLQSSLQMASLGNKPRVFLALYHRDKLSLPPHRNELGMASFHWALLITPKKESQHTHMLDVTDAMQIDPVRHIDTNPDRNWICRDNMGNPFSNTRLVLVAMIGKLKVDVRKLEGVVRSLRNECRVPMKDTPGENCFWWVKNAVQYLQAKLLLQDFDLENTCLEFQRQATARIDSRDIAKKRTEVVNITGSSCDIQFEA
jgi:hypothetical protein